MHPEKRLLDHPFYEAWERGDVTEARLANYAAAYQEFMDRVPTYWARVLDGLGIEESAGEAIVEEERQHAELWARWATELPEATDPPELTDLFDALDAMSPSELAGALYAYESQQPGVAETKREGLLEEYGFETDSLDFFAEHANEDDHVAFGERIREEYADEGAFERGFEAGADAVYHSLDSFTRERTQAAN